jgi:hypothetical protein
MGISVKALEEAIAIRRQIDALEKRLSSILRGTAARPTRRAPVRKKGGLTPAGRRKLSELMKARWARRKTKGTLQTRNPGTRYK